MQIHVRAEYGTQGPYSIEQLQDLVDKGRVVRNDMIWVEGTEDWVPLDQIAGIIVREAPLASSTPIENGPQVRPWVRFWARSIDGWLAVFLLAAPIRYFLPDDWDHHLINASIRFLAFLLWIPLEAFLLCVYGYTPGKALLRVKVRNHDDSRLSYEVALARSFSVWLKGMGTELIPLITLITYYRSYRKLSDRGVTDWDSDERVLVSHRIVGPERALIAVLAHVLFLALAIYEGISYAMSRRGIQF